MTSVTRTIADLPGPPALPLLGNALQLLRPSRAHLVCERWIHGHGPMVRIKVGRESIVAIAEREAIDEILRQRPDGYRRWATQRKVIEEISPSGVFSAEGEQWKHQRRLVLSALNIHYLSRYFDVVRTCTERLGKRFEDAAQAASPFAISEAFSSYTVDVTSTLALGDDLNTLERRDNELQGHLHRVMEMTGRRIASPFAYWRYFKLPADRAMDRSTAEMHRAIAGFLERARARMEAEPARYEEPKNLLESMLAAQRNDNAFSEDDLIGNVFTILLAGEDTTANTLAWTTWLLGGRPDIQARIATEAQEVLGAAGRPLPYEAMERLNYTEAVLRESMRLKPVAPFLPLEPLAEVTICATRIPAKTRLLLMTRLAARTSGGRSDEFYPDRWLEDDDATRAPKSLAFGAGPRFCPGRNLAFLEAKAVLATLCRDFEIELDGSASQVKEVFKLAMVPVGLRVTLRVRRTESIHSEGQALAVHE
ncbi:MAG TPA: cytochrome P450 [Solirubrobacteraceae bacterium]|jgi:cytochrome P450|nr:cytochrome P450 [Solirubrobacteraceae bacterium]